MTMLEKKDVDDYSITGCWTLTRDDVDDEYDTSNDGVGDDNNEDNDREDRKQAQVKRSTSGQYNGPIDHFFGAQPTRSNLSHFLK